MKKLFASVRSYLYDRGIPIDDRLSNFFIFMGILAAVLGTVITILCHAPIPGVLLTALIALATPLTASMTRISGRSNHFSHIITIGLILIMPCVWLTAGGSSGGVTIWYIYELFYIVLFSPVRKLPIYLIPALALNLATFAAEAHWPQLFYRFTDKADIYVSLIGSFIVVTAQILVTVIVQKNLYNNERAISDHQTDRTVNFIMSTANIIDARDGYTGGHSKRVAYVAVAIAREMGMTQEELDNMRTVALLHDIGKVGVPDSILNKPSRLTEQEFAQIRLHTTVGGNILKDMDFIPHVQEGALYHHERYDGTGYPFGLKGENIPLYARIICVADAYDAMSTDRIYRSRMSQQEIIAELRKCRGSHFDPAIAALFIQMLQGGFNVPPADQLEGVLSDPNLQ